MVTLLTLNVVMTKGIDILTNLNSKKFYKSMDDFTFTVLKAPAHFVSLIPNTHFVDDIFLCIVLCIIRVLQLPTTFIWIGRKKTVNSSDFYSLN